MVKIKIRINTIEGKNLAELESEFDKDEGKSYTPEEKGLLESIAELISTVDTSFGASGFVVFAPLSDEDHLPMKIKPAMG